MGLKIDFIRELVTTASPSTRVGGVIPGIGTGAAYAINDAFGTIGELKVPEKGTIATVIFIDLDDEGLRKDVFLSVAPFTATADNSAIALTDAALRNTAGVVSIDSFYDLLDNQVGIATPALWYHAPKRILYYQVVTRGTDNIAAGSLPELWFEITQ